MHPLALVMADVDHFKRLNDTFGHEVGDQVLKEVAAFIATHIRASDLACRYGGEEMLIIFRTPGSRQRKASPRNCGLPCARSPASGRARDRPVTILSLGVAAFPLHGTTSAALLRAADAALYQAKHQGRDRAIAAET